MISAEMRAVPERQVPQSPPPRWHNLYMLEYCPAVVIISLAVLFAIRGWRGSTGSLGQAMPRQRSFTTNHLRSRVRCSNFSHGRYVAYADYNRRWRPIAAKIWLKRAGASLSPRGISVSSEASLGSMVS